MCESVSDRLTVCVCKNCMWFFFKIFNIYYSFTKKFKFVVFKVKQTFKNDKVQISYKKVILKNSKSELGTV